MYGGLRHWSFRIRSVKSLVCVKVEALYSVGSSSVGLMDPAPLWMAVISSATRSDSGDFSQRSAQPRAVSPSSAAPVTAMQLRMNSAGLWSDGKLVPCRSK